MLITIANLLDLAVLQQVRELLPTLRWKDGAETAGATAREVKQNLQADLTSRTGVKIRDIVTSSIEAHPVLQAAAQPARFSKLILSKTEQGGGYGLHVDNAFMPIGDDKLRTDLSFTLFLSEPAEYVAGELQIEYAGQSMRLKPNAGDLVLYPSPSLHQVNAVSSGTRLVCVGWIESRIRRADDRETLFDLINLKAELDAHHDAQSAELLVLSKTIANLLRRFS